jgi:putative phosphoribosyl transferase
VFGDGFADRVEAGRALAREVARLDLADPVVLALPRGGVPVAVEVADALDCPLDVLVVRKVGAPGHEEFGLGAVGEGGALWLDDDVLRRLRVSRDSLAPTIERERAELDRRVARYRGGRPGVDVAGRDVVIVDDGVATGGTAHAAIEVVRSRGARTVVLAVPVGAPESIGDLERVADEVVCVLAPPSFMAVGAWYEDFHQVSDDEVVRTLGR